MILFKEKLKEILDYLITSIGFFMYVGVLLLALLAFYYQQWLLGGLSSVLFVILSRIFILMLRV